METLNAHPTGTPTVAPGAAAFAALLARIGRVIVGTAFGIFIVWVVTHWLWLVVHEGLLDHLW